MAITDNRAARRRATLISEVQEVVKKVAIVSLVVVVIVGAILGAAIYWAKKQTPAALARMNAEPQPMHASDLTGEQLAELIQVADPNFYSHHGYSLRTPGFETITQRLVAQNYFEGYQAWLEMGPGTVDAWVLNRTLSKDDQLKIFINTVRLGTSREHEVHGFQQAANLFFDKKFHELNREEYLSILAMIADPEKFHIQAEALANIERVNRIKKMLDGKCKASSIFDEELKNCR